MIGAEQRRNEILSAIKSEGKVKVSDLSRKFGVSEVSVRADLAKLESEGALRRVHGGAVGLRKLYINMDLNERFLTNAAAKKRLAAEVAALIEDHDTVFMNAGTTMTYVLRAMQGRRNVTLVTNSVPNATEAAAAGFEVILLGGRLDTRYQFTYGEDTIRQLENYHASKCILSIDGVDPAAGLTLYYSNEADMVRRMMASADTVIVAADGSKIGRSTFIRVAPVTGMHTLVTNKTADRTLLTALRESGIHVVES